MVRERERGGEILGRRDANAGYDIKDWNNMLYIGMNKSNSWGNSKGVLQENYSKGIEIS